MCVDARLLGLDFLHDHGKTKQKQQALDSCLAKNAIAL